MAGMAPLGYSSGGMVTKLAAGKIATSAGCRMVIADGRSKGPLSAIEDGARCTWFLADRGAADRPEALDRRRIEAPPVRSVPGRRRPGGAEQRQEPAARGGHGGPRRLRTRRRRGARTDVEGREIARGLTAYPPPMRASSSATRAVKSKHCSAIVAARNLIHRDDLVLNRLIGMGKEPMRKTMTADAGFCCATT